MTTSFRGSMETGDQEETINSPLSLNQEARTDQTCAMHTGDVYVCDVIPRQSFQEDDIIWSGISGPFSQSKTKAK